MEGDEIDYESLPPNAGLAVRTILLVVVSKLKFSCVKVNMLAGALVRLLVRYLTSYISHHLCRLEYQSMQSCIQWIV